jgi:iron complex transport system substrate-binding protein
VAAPPAKLIVRVGLVGLMASRLASALASSPFEPARGTQRIDPPMQAPRRIVSLIPSVTAMLVEIGAAGQIVGVSSYDDLPSLASLPRVGGLLDPDVERILWLDPDLVLVYASQSDLRRQLERAGRRLWVYKHGGLADVARTMRELGRVTGHQTQADARAAALEAEIEAIHARVAGRARPRVLLVFGRTPGALRGVQVSGGVGFLHDMLTTAGGLNVFEKIPRENVQIGAETILAERPEVIVELRYGAAVTPDEAARDLGAWQVLAAVPAVRSGRVHVLVGDHFVVPGPKVGLATAALARVLHPDAFDARR